MRNQLTYKKWTWDDDNFTYGTVDKELSLPVSSLGIDTVEGEVVCDDPAILDFQQNDPLIVSHRGRQIALAYIQSITRTGADRYVLDAISPVGRLAQMEHRGGRYVNVPLAQVVGDICGDVPFIIKSNLTNLNISGLLEYAKPSGDDSNGRSARDNLAQVLFAIGANLDTDNNGVLRIQNMWDGLSAYIDADRVYRDGASVISEAPVSSVTVVEHQWVEGGDVTTLFDGVATAGQVITFREPMYDLQATGLTIRESGANYAVLEAGTGTVTGRAYIHLTREITRAVSGASTVNQKRIEDATLVTLLNSTAVADRMADYYAHRVTISESVTINREHPGNVASIYDPFDRKQVVATLAKSGMNLSATIRSAIEALVGFRPPQADDQEYYDYRELLTGSGTWTVPAGVTSITVVLVGGGNGGLPGLAGSPAPAPTKQNYSQSASDSTTYITGYGFDSSGQIGRGLEGGEGGQPGTPGQGGKVLEITLSVRPGQTFRCSIGLGAVGTAFGSNVENEGGDTVFGDYSSASGSRSIRGFIDPITGEGYGVQGKAGVAGGKGASPEETPAGVTADGQTWTPGTHPSTVSQDGRGDWRQNYGYLSYYSESGYGGGAAYGANGGDGLSNGYGSLTSIDIKAVAATNGRGATALPPPAATGIGTGGTAGNGGGGQGSIGLTYSRCLIAKGLTRGGTDAEQNPTASAPGNGSAGGQGADGGVIIFYRRPVATAASGLFMEARQKRFLVDKTGRYFIT